MPDLGHLKAPADLLHLHHHVDQEVEKGADVVARKVAPTLRLPDQKRQLLEGERRRVSMNGGDRAGVAGVDVAQVPLKRLRTKTSL